MTTSLHLRDATREDTPDILALLNQTFRTPIDAATWEWYVYANPLGRSRIYVAIEPAGTMVGVIGFAPIVLRMDGIRVTADFAHHLVLTPAYRDTFSFIALNRHALQAQARLGIALAIGPPNRTAYPIHKTIMKWADFGFLDCLRKLKPEARSHRCRLLGEFPADFDRFYEQASRDLRFCVEKNQRWMNWRFSARPGNPYTTYVVTSGADLTGYVILKRWQDPDGYRKAHIMDIHALDDDSLAQLVAAADSYADGLDEINLWAVKGHGYRARLEALGFAANPAAYQPLIARAYDGSRLHYPDGACSFGYGDSDTLY